MNNDFWDLAHCCVCMYILHGLLLSGAVSEFTPAIYIHKTTSSFQCGQSDSIQDDEQMMETLKNISQILPAPQQSSSPTCIVIFYATIQMPHLATTRFRLPMAQL